MQKIILKNRKRRSSHIRKGKSPVVNIHINSLAENIVINTTPGSEFEKVAGDIVAEKIVEILNSVKHV